MFEFIQLVNDIVEAFFDGGVYQPHIGELNAMRLYYNYINPELDDVIDATDFAEIVKDEEFVKSYFAAIHEYSDKLDFVKAYGIAMDMVNTKKNSFGSFLDLVNDWLLHLGEFLSQENIDKIIDIANGIKDGEVATSLADHVAEIIKE